MASRGDIKDVVINMVGEEDISNLDQFVDWGIRDAILAHKWEFRKKTDFIATVAPVTLSDASITLGATALSEGTATPFTDTATDAGKKVATGYSSEYVEILTVTDTQNAVTADPWRPATVSGGTVIMYKDFANLPSDLEEIRAITVFDGSDSWPLKKYRGSDIDFPDSADAPEFYVMLPETAQGVKRIRFVGHAPDAAYNLKVDYWTGFNSKLQDARKLQIPDWLVPACALGALKWAYQRDHFRRSAQMAAEFEREVSKQYRNNGSSNSPDGFQMGMRGDVPQRPMHDYDIDDIEIA